MRLDQPVQAQSQNPKPAFVVLSADRALHLPSLHKVQVDITAVILLLQLS